MIRIPLAPRLVIAVLALATTAASAHRPTQPLAVSPPAHQVLNSGSILTSTTDVLEARQGADTATLIDQSTGTRRVIPDPADCRPAALGPTAIVYSCSSVAAAPELIEQIADGRTVPVDPVGTPIRAGSRWAEFDATGSDGHPTTTTFFANLTTGATVARAGRRTYADLDAPGLRATACSPVMVPLLDDGPADRLEPARLQFVGRLAVISSIPAGTPFATQRCGSHTITRKGHGSTFATNQSLIAWVGPAQTIDGIVASTGRGFRLRLHGSLGHVALTIEGLTSTTLFVQVDETGISYAVKLPPALRSG